MPRKRNVKVFFIDHLLCLVAGEVLEDGGSNLVSQIHLMVVYTYMNVK